MGLHCRSRPAPNCESSWNSQTGFTSRRLLPHFVPHEIEHKSNIGTEMGNNYGVRIGRIVKVVPLDKAFYFDDKLLTSDLRWRRNCSFFVAIQFGLSINVEDSSNKYGWFHLTGSPLSTLKSLAWKGFVPFHKSVVHFLKTLFTKFRFLIYKSTLFTILESDITYSKENNSKLFRRSLKINS